MNKLDILRNCTIRGNEILLPNEMSSANMDETKKALILLENLGGLYQSNTPTPRVKYNFDPSSAYASLMMDLTDNEIENEYLNRPQKPSNKPLIDQFMTALDEYIDAKMVVVNQSSFQEVKELKSKREVRRLLELLIKPN